MFSLQESICDVVNTIPFVWMSPLQLVNRLSAVFDASTQEPLDKQVQKTFPLARERKTIEWKDKYSRKNKTVEEKIEKQTRHALVEYERERTKEFFPARLTISLPICYEKTKKGVVGTFIGRRKEQEDTFCVTSLKINQQRLPFYAIYDGHAGSFAADYLKVHLHERLQENLEGFSTEEEFIDLVFHTFAEINEEIKQKELNRTSRRHSMSSGSTAICAIVWQKYLYLFNTGDSCGLLLNRLDGRIKPLNEFAKPDSERFSQSVIKNKGTILFGKIYTTLPSGQLMQLSLTRAFGDSCFPSVSSRPKLVKTSFDRNSILFLSCDGLLETMSRSTLGEKTIQLLNRSGGTLQKSVQAIIEGAYHSGSQDNLTLLLAELT